jgi:branched-chain amino acid transport system permease protein
MSYLSRRIPNPKARAAITSAAGLLLLLLFTQLVLPGNGGGRGTPAALLFTGLVNGLLTAVTGVGLVLIYRSTRIINFAQIALGVAGGQLTFQLLTLTSTPFFVALALGLLTSGLMGLIFELVIGVRFRKAPRLVLTVATIAVAGLMATTMSSLVQKIPFIPKAKSIDEVLGQNDLRPHLPFKGLKFTVGSFPIPFGFPELFAIVATVSALVAVTFLLRFTRIGVAMRGMAENVERSALLGISATSISMIVWTVAGLLSGLGVIMTGVLNTPAAATGYAPQLLLPALAAAVIGRMSSIPVTVAAAVGIDVVSYAFIYSFKNDGALISVVLFAVVAVGLLLQRDSITRAERGGGVTWEATREQRPVPREMVTIPGIRVTRYTGLAVIALAIALYPLVFSAGQTFRGSVVACFMILALSMLVLTGWAGQVSLGQFGLAGVGAVIGSALMMKAHIPFWFSAPLAMAFTGAFSALIGIPALRIRGLFLAVSTFAFGVAVTAFLFNNRYTGWLVPTVVNRPKLFLLDFQDERSMYYLTAVILVLSVMALANLRRTRFGRIVIAVRENDANLQSVGVAAVRAKLMAFAVSGALAGLAGFLLATVDRGVSGQSFDSAGSIQLFLIAVIGGIGSIQGVLLGSLLFYAVAQALSGNIIFQALQFMLPLVLLYLEPSGLIGMVNRLRDSVLRIVAQRRQMIVPSLFADVDPAALSARLIPLAEAGSGSRAVAAGGRRFALNSEIYVSRHRRASTSAADRVRIQEAELFRADSNVYPGEMTPETTAPAETRS